MSQDASERMSPLGANARIHHIALSVANLPDSVKWYEEKLGFTERMRLDLPPAVDGPRDFMVLIECGEIFIELITNPSSTPNPDAFVPYMESADRRGYVHGSFQVGDAHEVMRALAARGVQVQKHVAMNALSGPPLDDRDIKAAWFWDLDGHLFQLWSGELGRGAGEWKPAPVLNEQLDRKES